jgi:hypothetical protein
MAQFYTDFQTETVATLPSGWASKWASPSKAEIVDVGGQKALEVVRGSNAPHMIGWDTVGTAADVEVFAVVQTLATVSVFHNPLGITVRGAGAAGSATGYATHLFGFSSTPDRDFRTNRWSNGSVSAPANNAHKFLWQQSAVYCYRARSEGTAHKAKIWAPASPYTDPTGDEPGSWQIEFTNADITAAGWVGFGTLGNDGAAANRLYAIGVGTGGDTAPTSDDEPTGTQLATPSGHVFTASGRSLRQEWNAVDGADDYQWEIQRRDGGVWVAFDSGGGDPPVERGSSDGVTYDTTYRARVRALPPVSP